MSQYRPIVDEAAEKENEFEDIDKFLCQICFCSHPLKDKAKMDACQQHDFCYDCLMQWVMTKNTCPSCNVPIKFITTP